MAASCTCFLDSIVFACLVNISNINFSNRKIDFYEIIIDIEVRDANHLNNIIAALRLVTEVSSLERIKG